ncbi:MAG: helix-turn-helix transcriptional regulator [Kiritimatiellae bacterium]|nr:helix-turn-helix transcriptional regulator [Kiritimatiellia bacterium]MBR1836184.1 helix-turn-helix transcriptional regulator [Kiritimatiellia bacterium]
MCATNCKCAATGPVAEALAAALRRLGRSKPFESLTVREIAREAGVSTRTFYNRFRSKYDLVMKFYAWEDVATLCRGRKGAPLPSFRDLVLAGLVRFGRDRAMFVGAFREIAGPESFCELLLAHSVCAVSDYAEQRNGNPLPPEAGPALRIYCAGVVRLVGEWLESPSPKSAAEFLEDVVSGMPAPLRPFLL